jgi:hypothetical protein
MAVKRSQAGSTAPPDGSRIAIASAASHDSRGERESPKGQQHEDDDDRGPVADPITKGGPLCFEARDGPRAAASVPAPPRGAPPLRCRRVRRRRSLALAGSRAAAPGAGIRSRGRSLDFQDVLAKPAVKGIRRSAQASAVVPVRSIVPSAIIDRRSSTTHRGFPPARATSSIRLAPAGRPNSARTRATTSALPSALRRMTVAPDSTQSSRNWPSSSDRGAGRKRRGEQQRHLRELASNPPQRQQRRAVGPMQILQRHQHRTLEGQPLDQINDCLHHPELQRPSRGRLRTGSRSPAIRRPTAARRGSAVRRERPPRLPHEPPRSHCSADASCRSPPHPRPTPSRPRRPSRHESGAQAPRAHARGRSIYLRTPATRRQPDRSTGDTQGRRCGRARRCRPREPDQRS